MNRILKQTTIYLMAILIIMGIALEAKTQLVEKMTEYQTTGYSIKLTK